MCGCCSSKYCTTLPIPSWPHHKYSTTTTIQQQLKSVWERLGDRRVQLYSYQCNTAISGLLQAATTSSYDIRRPSRVMPSQNALIN